MKVKEIRIKLDNVKEVITKIEMYLKFWHN